METKEIKISVPEGYCIDKENSTFECIKFKKKSLTYDDVAKELFYHKSGYYIPSSCSYIAGNDAEQTYSFATDEYNGPHNATSKKQLEKLLALNKLMNIAKYFNGKDWKLDWNNQHENKFFIWIDNHNSILVDYSITINSHITYFKTRELAQKAIKILGEDTIRLALSTDW